MRSLWFSAHWSVYRAGYRVAGSCISCSVDGTLFISCEFHGKRFVGFMRATGLCFLQVPVSNWIWLWRRSDMLSTLRAFVGYDSGP